MPRITKVYTKQGDRGETRLAGGERLSKDSPRIEAYGTVDELGSQIGAVLATGRATGGAAGGAGDGAGAERVGGRCREILAAVQNDLFHLGSSLAYLPEEDGSIPGPRLEERHVAALEGWIDEVNAGLEPLENFVLPGGTPSAARLHVARCVCRRAERRLVALGREEPLPEHALVYLNRLSDLLFVLARAENARAGVDEPLWDSRV